MSSLFKKLLESSLGGYAAVRTITRLQALGGQGDKVFPPTYAGDNGGIYAWEERLLEGQRVPCVLLDSVQSQANRMEEALLDAVRTNKLKLPLFEVQVNGNHVTSLETPHRVHDAIFRDSEIDGKPFGQSAIGQALLKARVGSAEPFFRYAPTVLLFGGWDSQSGGGVNSAKIPRSLVSEITGIGAVKGVRTSSRIDPLGIKKLEIFGRKGSGDWGFKKDEKDWAKLKPSDMNHGNIPPSINADAGGVTIQYAVQTSILSFTQLRRIRFGGSIEADAAGRAVIAALGLFGLAGQRENGYNLRSRCELIPLEPSRIERINAQSGAVEPIDFDSASALEALDEGLRHAKGLGLEWRTDPVHLKASEKLLRLKKESDELVAEG